MKKNKGFTLIELLVVIAIIGILTSVILAGIRHAKNPTDEKQDCLEKIDIGFGLHDLPAKCLKYVEMPDGMTVPTEEKW